MPATESTWRDTRLMHRIFAVVGVLLTIATIWMFQADYSRRWKEYQANVVNVDLKMNKWRQEQFQTEDALIEHEKLTAALQRAKSQPVDPQLLAAFKTECDEAASFKGSDKEGAGYHNPKIDFSVIDADAARLEEQAKVAAEKRQQADELAAQAAAAPDNTELAAKAGQAEREANAAEKAASDTRDALLNRLNDIVIDAKNLENKVLQRRKFKSADLDADRANLDIGIRDNVDAKTRAQLQEKIDNTKRELDALNLNYQSLSAHRKLIEKLYNQMTSEAESAEKALTDSLAGLTRLKTAYQDKRETWVDFAWGFVPVPGKKVLTLPILDAFMSPRRPENLWADGLEQDYNFRKVRRFDRCTTCHGSMQKTMPGDATAPAYIAEQRFEVLLPAVNLDELPKDALDEDGLPKPSELIKILGMRLANEGVLDSGDVTVSLVQPKSPAARAKIVGQSDQPAEELSEQLRMQFASKSGPQLTEPEQFPRIPGLLVGDVIELIEGSQYDNAKRAAAALTDLARDGKPIRLTIRRGLPNPYTSHPRLDLFVGDSSPHPMGTFACTICHDGQGSATDFTWASHTPNTHNQFLKWVNDYGYFENHHWIYPMYPKRFNESSCLKCHHDVIELEPSDRFPEAPAPKLVHGYHLIRKYGCFGCHEINGFDGPDRRIGPDLRLEPNYYAIGQELLVSSNLPAVLKSLQEKAKEEGADQAALRDQERKVAGLIDLAQRIVRRPEDNDVRINLRKQIEDDSQLPADQQVLSPAIHQWAGLLRDVEVPGKLRKPGPSLRFMTSKLDNEFAYDWIRDPQNFRPSTRMPRFFGLWDHLQGEDQAASLKMAQQREPIEILGTIAYLNAVSQDFEPVKRPEGISEWPQEDKIARGKTQFETRGCLACHSHQDFPDVEKYRRPGEIVQGPDLSGIGQKFDPAVNPRGRDWLYSWIKDPTRYHPRTVMPNLYLDPEKTGDGQTFDPADDIVDYLLNASKVDWNIDPNAKLASKLNGETLTEENRAALQALSLEYLNETFYQDDADRYYKEGIPPEMRPELKGAEVELIVEPGQQLTDEQRLRYIGKRTINKYGCFGCHDIPGFEDAKPIGTGLADWGRKDPSKLAFEHITHYIEHGHGHGHAGGGHGGDSHAKGDAHPAPDSEAAIAADLKHAEEESRTEYYDEQIRHGNRIGFLWQKLKEPRSFDYEKTANKRYNERLRMPQFPFDADEREAVATFILGLVADPPTSKYVFTPDDRMKAILAGRDAIEKFNCAGCHILSGDKLQLAFGEDEFGPQGAAADYPFLQPDFSPKSLAASAETDRRNLYHATIEGLPALDRSGWPLMIDAEGAPLEDEELYSPAEVGYAINLTKPTVIAGSPYITGQGPVVPFRRQIEKHHPSDGGVLTKYLLPRVTQLEQESNPNATGAEAYSWLPPPLMGEGSKVQPNWLNDFLLEPYAIRPATFLRMPKFNMSTQEAADLVNYFAAVDNAQYPYEASTARDANQLAERDEYYQQLIGQNGGGKTTRFDDAMKIVVDNNFCVKCHAVGDFEPAGSARAKAPNLADVYRRLRPEYLRDWIANPKSILPYTPMPVNIPYKPDEPNLGGVSQDLYHGTSIEQVDALVDLLMNYDTYTRRQTRIADLVKPAAGTEEAPNGEGTPPAGAETEESSATGSSSAEN